jgi:hypothetical protein
MDDSSRTVRVGVDELNHGSTPTPSESCKRADKEGTVTHVLPASFRFVSFRRGNAILVVGVEHGPRCVVRCEAIYAQCNHE